MKRAVLFDLGQTLVRHFESHEFPGILEQAIASAREELRRQGLPIPASEQLREQVAIENHEAPDDQVRPLGQRLQRIFGIPPEADAALTVGACRAFLEPIVGLGQVYEDTVPVLRALRARGLRTALVSNTCWGSPGGLWREDLERHGLAGEVDVAVFCTDVGWRKPDRRIFEHALALLGLRASDCVFVGDHPRWDVSGAQGAGIDALLIDRGGTAQGEGVIHDLWSLLDLV